MLRIFKKKTVISPSMAEVENNIKASVMNFIENNKIENLLYKDTTVEMDGEVYIVNIKAGEPGKLIGYKGCIVKKLTKRMSKHLDIPLKVNVGL